MKKVKRFQTRKIDVPFSEKLDFYSSSLNRKRVRLPRKNVGFLAAICLIYKFIEYTNDHSLNAHIIPTFSDKVL